MRTIAILIPCYNSATYLPELFEGIQKQSVPFDEVICYDDCSTDNTIEVAESLGAKVIKGIENRGPAYARNRLIEASTADYIHFHDSDDLIDPKFAEIMMSSLDNENVQLLCNTYVFDRETRKQNLGNITYDTLSQEKDQLLFFIENVGFASMGLYNRKALLDIAGFREDIKGNEDPDLHIRLSAKGYKIKPVEHFLVTKLEHSTSFSHQHYFQCLHDKLKCLQYYKANFDSPYYSSIGKQAAELSNYFYKEGAIQLSNEARDLVEQTKLKELSTIRFSTLISKILGVKAYLWLYRRRVDLKLV